MFESPAFQRVLERLTARAVHDPTDTEVRMVVQTRARNACEYCLMPTRSRFEVDHIIPVGHWQAFLAGRLPRHPLVSDREPHHLENFAWSCAYCNGFKGERVTGRARGRVSSLFHPRRDRWEEHFLLRDNSLYIDGVTEIGAATVQVLAFNDTRLNGPSAIRHRAIIDKIYPPEWARTWGF